MDKTLQPRARNFRIDETLQPKKRSLRIVVVKLDSHQEAKQREVHQESGTEEELRCAISAMMYTFGSQRRPRQSGEQAKKNSEQNRGGGDERT